MHEIHYFNQVNRYATVYDSIDFMWWVCTRTEFMNKLEVDWLKSFIMIYTSLFDCTFILIYWLLYVCDLLK